MLLVYLTGQSVYILAGSPSAPLLLCSCLQSYNSTHLQLDSAPCQNIPPGYLNFYPSQIQPNTTTYKGAWLYQLMHLVCFNPKKYYKKGTISFSSSTFINKIAVRVLDRFNLNTRADIHKKAVASNSGEKNKYLSYIHYIL